MASEISRNMFDVTDRVAVVTGAGSGLGRVFAQALAAFGAKVVCTDVDRDGNQETVDLIKKNGGAAREVHTDVSDEESVAGLGEDLRLVENRLDILVNNAGIATGSARVHEMSVGDWDRLMRVNLRGVFLCMRAMIPLMLENSGGSIINISSIAGLAGVDPIIGAMSANYSAAKAGVVGLTRQAAAEYGADGIRVNAIAPGWHMGTNLGRESMGEAPPEMMEQMMSRLEAGAVLRRTGQPEELAGLVVYLASDASSFVTGEVIAHDGGWLAI